MRTLFALAFILNSASAIEGFYPLDQLPSAELKHFGLKEATITHAARSTGFLIGDRAKDFKNIDEINIYKTQFCQTPVARDWNANLCQLLDKTKCEAGCQIKDKWILCSGVFIADSGQTYFVTARHCVDQYDSGATFNARFKDEKGQMADLPLVPTSLTHHHLPGDAVVFAIGSGPVFATLEARDMKQGDAVFGAGFPYLRYRGHKYAAYPIPAGDLRIALGKVVNANLKHESYCAFSNDNDAANPHAWVLQKGCEHFDYTKLSYPGSEARNPLLTDSDMTFGMSGSPLFNSLGKVVGIGSTILGPEPKDYVATDYAVYVKGDTIATYLKILHNQKR